VFTQHLKTSTVNTSTDHLKAFLQVVSEIVQTTNVRAQTTAETLKTMLVEDAHLTKVNIRQLMTFFKVWEARVCHMFQYAVLASKHKLA
jgi:hypothetical protein